MCSSLTKCFSIAHRYHCLASRSLHTLFPLPGMLFSSLYVPFCLRVPFTFPSTALTNNNLLVSPPPDSKCYKGREGSFSIFVTPTPSRSLDKEYMSKKIILNECISEHGKTRARHTESQRMFHSFIQQQTPSTGQAPASDIVPHELTRRMGSQTHTCQAQYTNMSILMKRITEYCEQEEEGHLY